MRTRALSRRPAAHAAALGLSLTMAVASVVAAPGCGARSVCATMCACADCEAAEIDACGVATTAVFDIAGDSSCLDSASEATCESVRSTCQRFEGQAGLSCGDAATLACISLCEDLVSCNAGDTSDGALVACASGCLEGTLVGDTCTYANDDACDEPNLCDPGTDATDCGNFVGSGGATSGGGPGFCGDGSCDPSIESCDSCETDCGPCTGSGSCGDGFCDGPDEGCGNCADDCGACDPNPVCDSGIIFDDPAIAECLGSYCCTEFNECTGYGDDVDPCIECIRAGGGFLCDDAIACANSNCF